jgi:hypothetical protein
MMNKRQVKQEAAQQFAEANGWRVGNPFNRYRLAGVRWTDFTYCSSARYATLGDHAEYFWKDRRPAAIVAHNYPAGNGDDGTPFLGRALTGKEPELEVLPGGGNHYGVADIAREAGKLGLVTHVAPAGAAASWYYPNWTLLLVVTRPGIEVVWPTSQQMVATAMLWAIRDYHARRKQAEARRLRESDALAEQDFA